MLERKIYKVEEVAELLGISRPQAYKAVKDGIIPSLRIGRRLLVPKARVEELLNTPIGAIYLEPQLPTEGENIGYENISQNGTDLVYLIQLDSIKDPELFKIGYSNEICNRLATIQTLQPRAKLIKTWKGNIALETLIHNQLKLDKGVTFIRNELYECLSAHYLVVKINAIVGV